MGSFNLQCFASKQVINEGTLCRVVPLIQGRSCTPAVCTFAGRDTPAQLVYGDSRTVNIDGPWLPYVGFLEATAADGGSQTLLETRHNVLVLTELYTEMYVRCAVVAEGENPSHDLAFNFHELLAEKAPEFLAYLQQKQRYTSSDPIQWSEAEAVWDGMATAHHRKRLFFADYGRVFRPMTFGVMHEDAYQWLQKLGETTKGWNGSMARGTYVPTLIEAALRDAKAFYDEREPGEQAVEPRHRLVSEAFMAESSIRDGIRRIGGDAMLNSAMSFRLLHKGLIAHVRDGVAMKEALLEPLDSLFDDLYVLRGMDLCNVQFTAPQYAGQDYDNEQGKLYAKLVAATAKSVNLARKRQVDEF